MKTLILLLLTTALSAQVTNGSFEVAGCPNMLGNTADNWQNRRCDADLLSRCDESSQLDYSCVGVPCNWFGCQEPQDGNNYIAICLGAVIGEVREWITGEIQPMIKDSVYLVEFYYSRSDRYNIACNNIGAYFGELPYQNLYLTLYTDVDYSKVIYERNVLVDTTQWVKFSQYYIAKGGEKNITLGNFYSDFDTKYVEYAGEPDFNYAYYYIDNVSVTKVVATSLPEYVIKKSTPKLNYTILGQIK